MRDVDKGSSLDGWDKRESHSTARDAAIVQCDVGSLGKQNLFLAGRFLARAPNRIWNLA